MISTQKKNENKEEFKKALEEKDSEGKPFFTENEIIFLTETRTRKVKSEDVRDSTYDAPIEKCEEAGKLMEGLMKAQEKESDNKGEVDDSN